MLKNSAQPNVPEYWQLVHLVVLDQQPTTFQLRRRRQRSVSSLLSLSLWLTSHRWTRTYWTLMTSMRWVYGPTPLFLRLVPARTTVRCYGHHHRVAPSSAERAGGASRRVVTRDATEAPLWKRYGVPPGNSTGVTRGVTRAPPRLSPGVPPGVPPNAQRVANRLTTRVTTGC